MKKLIIVVLSSLLFSLPAIAQKEQPKVEIIIINPIQEICMGAQKKAIESIISEKKQDLKKWTIFDANNYLTELVTNDKIPVIAPVIMSAVNESLEIVIGGQRLSTLLAAVTQKCINDVKRTLTPSTPKRNSSQTVSA